MVMRFITRFVCLALPVLAVGMPILPSTAQPAAMSKVTVLEQDRNAAYAKFELEGLPDELTSPLVFDFRLNQYISTADGPDSTRLLLNSAVLDLSWDREDQPSQLGAVTVNATNGGLTPILSHHAVHGESIHSLTVHDHFGFARIVELSISGHTIFQESPNQEYRGSQILNFSIRSVDGFPILYNPGFTLAIRINPFPEITPPSRPVLEAIFASSPSQEPHFDNLMPASAPSYSERYDEDEAIDLEAEIRSLIFLEEQAENLQAEIATRKQKIASRLRQHRDQVSLKHLLDQCDGVMCAAKVIAQKICDKVGIVVEPSFKYTRVHSLDAQGVIALGEKSNPEGNAFEKQTHHTQYTSLNGTADVLPMVEFNSPVISLMHVLELVATALGLTALFSFIRRKCMSPRSRAERAADREERRNARAYRRAARRAYVTRQWNALVTALNCFKPQDASHEKRVEDYEEKRALILQDAFLEQELDVAEKGEVMEAEIRELRNAHEIVRSLVRHGEQVPPMYHDPPPTLVPLPESFTPVTGRSRASTNTLPSYTSESLPDYSSRPDAEHNPLLHSPSLDGLSSSGLGSSSSDTGDDRANSLFSPIELSEDGNGLDEDSRRERRWRQHHGSRSTPTSSVVETSPRPSQETLWTAGRNSGEC